MKVTSSCVEDIFTTEMTRGEFLVSQEEAIISTIAALTIVASSLAHDGDTTGLNQVIRVAGGLSELYRDVTGWSSGEIITKGQERITSLLDALGAEVRS